MPWSAYLPEFAALALVHFLAVVAPGPDFAVTVQHSVRHGRATGVATALGIGTGLSLHVGYTLLGMGALLHAHPALLRVASGLGALYLAWLGWQLLRSAPRPSAAEPGTVPPATPRLTWRAAFVRGFLTNATNPKATLFFLAVFTTLVSPATPLAVQALYGVWMCAVNAAWFTLVAVLFTLAPVRQAFLRLGHWLERAMGVLLLGFAARLVLR